MKFQNPSMHGLRLKDGRTDGQPETTMLLQLLRRLGHNYPYKCLTMMFIETVLGRDGFCEAWFSK